MANQLQNMPSPLWTYIAFKIRRAGPHPVPPKDGKALSPYGRVDRIGVVDPQRKYIRRHTVARRSEQGSSPCNPFEAAGKA